MSKSDSSPSQHRAPSNSSRQVARRAFASELNDATYTFKESDAERAPVFALLPTGAAANRYFFVGTLTEAEDIGTDSEYWRGRIVDPTGTVFVYAGQYQQDAANLLRTIEPPAYVAVVGKPRTYETDDGDTLVSVRPESITVVDAETRDRWVVETAQQTLERLEAFDAEDNQYSVTAREEYDPDLDTYREAVIDALESLDEIDDVDEDDDSENDQEDADDDAGDDHASGDGDDE